MPRKQLESNKEMTQATAYPLSRGKTYLKNSKLRSTEK
jgi:hypothetical protein